MSGKRKTKDYGFITFGFSDITRNQKLAIINFLSVIASSNIAPKISKSEQAFINFYYKEFGVSGDQYLAYLSIGGRAQTISDIKTLTKSNMQDLVYATTELCICDGEATDDQLNALSNWLNDIGITIEEWNEYLENPF
ncbi:MAG: hypothetical protein Q8908_08525 [Bacteroidota bacterium]|nr:hypothetical protein [Bacteroidota bacterium]